MTCIFQATSEPDCGDGHVSENCASEDGDNMDVGDDGLFGDVDVLLCECTAVELGDPVLLAG